MRFTNSGIIDSPPARHTPQYDGNCETLQFLSWNVVDISIAYIILKIRVSILFRTDAHRLLDLSRNGGAFSSCQFLKKSGSGAHGFILVALKSKQHLHGGTA